MWNPERFCNILEIPVLFPGIGFLPRNRPFLPRNRPLSHRIPLNSIKLLRTEMPGTPRAVGPEGALRPQESPTECYRIIFNSLELRFSWAKFLLGEYHIPRPWAGINLTELILILTEGRPASP